MKSKGKTPEQVAAEIAALTALQPKVRRFNAFGDDHREAIAAQIAVLGSRMDLDTIDGEWGDDTADEYDETLHSEAIRAHDWMNGLLADDTPMSKEWQELVP